MLSIHTLLGCDSTSRVSSTDKGAALTKFSAGYTQSCKVRKKDITYTHKIGAGKKKIENFSRSTQVNEAAPAGLLKLIRCSCKDDCSKRTCTCRRFNLKFSNICGECIDVSSFKLS